MNREVNSIRSAVYRIALNFGRAAVQVVGSTWVIIGLLLVVYSFPESGPDYRSLLGSVLILSLSLVAVVLVSLPDSVYLNVLAKLKRQKKPEFKKDENRAYYRNDAPPPALDEGPPPAGAARPKPEDRFATIEKKIDELTPLAVKLSLDSLVELKELQEKIERLTPVHAAKEIPAFLLEEETKVFLDNLKNIAVYFVIGMVTVLAIIQLWINWSNPNNYPYHFLAIYAALLWYLPYFLSRKYIATLTWTRLGDRWQKLPDFGASFALFGISLFADQVKTIIGKLPYPISEAEQAFFTPTVLTFLVMWILQIIISNIGRKKVDEETGKDGRIHFYATYLLALISYLGMIACVLSVALEVVSVLVFRNLV